MNQESSVTRVLAVDDEPQVLSALQRVFRGGEFELVTATSGSLALEELEKQPFDILLSDMRMPEMDGATFLAKSIDIQPSARRVLLTGYSDQESTVRAINEGQVHQYLTKPWENQALRDLVISEAILKQEHTGALSEDFQQLKSQVAEAESELAQASTYAELAKEELLKQANTTIKVISGLANQMCPTPRGFTQKVISHSMALAKLLKLDKRVITELRTAGLLFQLGKLMLSDELRRIKPFALSTEQRKQYDRYGMLGADLLLPISGLDFSAHVLRHLNENVDGSGPLKLKGKTIPLGSRILRLTVDFQQLSSGLLVKDPLSADDACAYLLKHTGKRYDAALTKLYVALIKKLASFHPDSQDSLILPSELKTDMTVSRDVVSNEGIFLLAKGSVLSASLIDKLNAYLTANPQELNIFVHKT